MSYASSSALRRRDCGHGRGTAPNASELPKPDPNPVAPGGEAGDWMEGVSAKDLSFKSRGTNALSVKPMYRITDEKYGVYWTTPEKKA